MGIKVGGLASTLFTVDTDSEPSVSSVCMIRCMYGRRRIVLRWFHRLDLHHELFTGTVIFTGICAGLLDWCRSYFARRWTLCGTDLAPSVSMSTFEYRYNCNMESWFLLR